MLEEQEKKTRFKIQKYRFDMKKISKYSEVNFEYETKLVSQVWCSALILSQQRTINTSQQRTINTTR